MTYFETPDHLAAHVEGLSLTAYYEREERLIRAAEDADPEERDLDPEDRRFVSENDIDPVSDADRRSFDLMVELSEFYG